MKKVMRNKKVIAMMVVGLVAIFLAASGVIASPPMGAGDPPVESKINYQGQLTDDAGNPLDGTYDMWFRFYDAATGGSPVMRPIPKNDVAVTDGLFSVKLGVDQAAFNGQGLWLEVMVEGETLSPRQEILPVPYALSLVPGARIVGDDTSDLALRIENKSAYGDGVYVSTAGDFSWGVHTRTYGDESKGVWAYTSGDESEGVYAYTSGKDSPAVSGYSLKDVGVCGKGKKGGYFATITAGTFENPLAGVHVSTAYDANPGVQIETTGEWGRGVFARTYGEHSDGLKAFTYGDGYSCGLHAVSYEYHAIMAATGRADHKYAFTTPDHIYVGGKIDLGLTLDPIIVEGFKTDPSIDYEVGDVVCLDEHSGYVKPCSISDDTRVVGVVGPTVEIEEGEISVVIMGHQGAKPDEEYVDVVENELERAEARMAEIKQGKNIEEKENLEKEITMLTSEIEEAKGVTRQVVKIKVDASYSPIKIGDLLTTSPTEGRAMKAQPVDIGGIEIYRPGTIIGKALEPLESGTGLIEVFVTLQ